MTQTVEEISVFPTRVGVNRKEMDIYTLAYRIPHTRGGEPQSAGREERNPDVFPTRVGVNRPDQERLFQKAEYSPHAWG